MSRLLEHLPGDGGMWWGQERVEYHRSMMTKAHRKKLDIWSRQENIIRRTFFRRKRNGQQCAEMREDDIAGCLRTLSGESARQFLVCAGQGIIRMRSRTPCEYARLQGVPDHCPLPGSERQIMTAMGDAVCVPVITWIAAQVVNPLVTGKHPGGRRIIQTGLFD